MIIYKKTTKIIDVVDKVYCDFCNKEFDEITTKSHGFGQIHISFGYGSKFDASEDNYQICDNCYTKIIHKHLKPQVQDVR